MSRREAGAWLLARSGEGEAAVDHALDQAVTEPEGPAVGAYTVTWDPATRFAIWPGHEPDVTPVSGPAAQLMCEATRRARQHAARITAARGGTGSPAARTALAAAGTASTEQAVRSYRAGGPWLDDGQAAWLSVVLADTQVRNDALSRMDPEYRDAHQMLWSDVTRRAQPGYVAAPASLLAFTALQCGDQQVAAAALDRALADQPSYPLAHLLAKAHRAGLPAARYIPTPAPGRSGASRARAAARDPGHLTPEPEM